MMAAAIIEGLIVSIGIPLRFTTEAKDIPVLLTISLMTQITLYCIIYIINYAVTIRSEMQIQREKANMAQYRYLKLKRQVNPHFLFNSLNVLDCIVCDEKTEQASTYIHKLAGIYRYMLKSEDDEIVQMRDELVFVGLYVDLLKVRFPEGFEVNIDVSDEDMARFVLPCSIQLLIENATKHNAVSVDKPLVINVKSDGRTVSVCNNIVPKVTKSQSTGLGHKYIRQQYMDLSGKEIDIIRTSDSYCVTLPLL
jgi:LytS/YehU family sensor histidine kinase